MIRTIHTLPIPVIAAVNGHAIGAGFALAAASDLRVAGNTAKFADGFVRRGISGCELGLSYFLPKLVGASVAFDWMLTGRRIEAEETALDHAALQAKRYPKCGPGCRAGLGGEAHHLQRPAGLAAEVAEVEA